MCGFLSYLCLSSVPMSSLASLIAHRVDTNFDYFEIYTISRFALFRNLHYFDIYIYFEMDIEFYIPTS